MNRLVCTNLDVATPASQAALPPPRAASSPRDPSATTRVLFVNGAELGFATTGRTLQHYTAQRDDIEAVHFSIAMPRWLRLATADCPIRSIKYAGLDLHVLRQLFATRRILEPLLRGPLGVVQHRYDVVHIMTQARGMTIPTLRRETSARWVVNADATVIQFEREFGFRNLLSRRHHAIERDIYHACDAVACASRWVADSVVSEYGLPPERTFLHMPCARRLPGAEPRRADAHLHRADRRLRLVFVGNAWRRKGGPRLLAWHQQRWADRAELHICSAEAPVDRAARNVIWHGATAHDKLIREILPACDLFVMPTREDTFLIAAQEAHTMGLPVVTSRLAGIPEVVLHDRTGLLCPRGDDHAFIVAIERPLNDASLLTRFSAAAAEHARLNLNADIWHNHLLDQIVSLANHRAVKFTPRDIP
ncbi:MAG: glycosyltransferase family 4 protein [Phycisphaerales bacterium]|nr:glycosyltransferase family 4 protein [Phycisphaerales bacterium]